MRISIDKLTAVARAFLAGGLLGDGVVVTHF